MKKQTVKIIVLCLLVCMVFAAGFFGCKSSTSDVQKGKSSAEQSSNKSLPDKLKDATVSALFWEGTASDAFIEPIRIYEQKYGTKVNTIMTTWAEMDKKIITMVVAGDAPDIVFWNQGMMPRYFIQGIVQPIEPYVDLTDPVWAGSLDSMNQFKYKGKHYGVSIPPIVFMTLFNQTMFENAGVKTPLEYSKEGKWNWETFVEVAKKLTQDTNRDGVIDQWGANLNSIPAIIYGNGAEVFNINTDGSIELTANDSKVVEALQLFQDGIHVHKYAPQKAGNAEAMFAQSQVAMTLERPNAFGINVKRLEEYKMKDEMGLAPFPSGPSAKQNVYPGFCSMWGITTGAKNPEAAGVLLYLRQKVELDEEDAYFAQFYTPDQIELIKECRKNLNVIKSTGLGGASQKLTAMFNEIRSGKPVTTTIDKHIPVIKEQLDILMRDMN